MMAAQAPLMMMNPMSMFGFNPMNYSAALENAGFPAKFSQVQNGANNNTINPLTSLNPLNVQPTGMLNKVKSTLGMNTNISNTDLMNNINVF